MVSRFHEISTWKLQNGNMTQMTNLTKRLVSVHPWESYDDLTEVQSIGAALVLVIIAALSILGNLIVVYYFTR